MSRDSFLFWIAVIGAPATVLSCVYQILAYHWPKGGSAMTGSRSRGVWVNGLLALLVCLAVGVDYYDRHNTRPLIVTDIVNSWGVAGIPPTGRPRYSVLVDTKELLNIYDDSYKLMLLVRVASANVDRMTDTAIEKSGLYTLTGDVIAIQHDGEDKLRFPLDVPTYAQLNVVLLPSGITPAQITCLADVTKLGGVIIGHPSQAVAGHINPPSPTPPAKL